jgi:glutathione synthase/RimK-type ligase-like ATP-grasp enzyme
MSVMILRRRKLGRTSCREIAKHVGAAVHRNDRKYKGRPVATVIRWGCTANLPNYHDNMAIINTAEAIHQVNDKVAFRKLMPEGICPKTWYDLEDFADTAEYTVEGKLEFPVIVRPSRHAQGRQLFYCEYTHQVQDNCEQLGDGNYYISKFIPKVAEYRVFVVGGRVVCVAKKTPGNPDAIAWNVAQGGRFDNVKHQDWPIKAVKASVIAFCATKLDFGGVDVMVDAEGKAYVLEINSAPSLTSEYRQKCMGLGIKYLVDHGKERIPVKELERNKYRGYVHPAVSDKAEV